MVDGILSLVSGDPRKDRDELGKRPLRNRDRKLLEGGDEARTPLRHLYRQGNDLAIYQVCRNFFAAAGEAFWDERNERSFIGKTVGVQALFDVLRQTLGQGRIEITGARKGTFLEM